MMGHDGGLSVGKRMKKDCAALLRGLVARDETIVAMGTAHELRTLGPHLGSGSGATFIVVTEGRALFAKWGSPEKPHEEIRINEVTHWGHGRQYNCYVVVLTHHPVTRREPAPAKQFLWLTWGRAQVDISRTQTIFRFIRAVTRRVIEEFVNGRAPMLAYESGLVQPGSC